MKERFKERERETARGSSQEESSLVLPGLVQYE